MSRLSKSGREMVLLEAAIEYCLQNHIPIQVFLAAVRLGDIRVYDQDGNEIAPLDVKA